MTSLESADSGTDTAKTSEDKKPEGPITSRLNLFNNKEYSDVTFHCADKVWHCHQAILFSRCPALKDLMKTDGADRKITLPNDCVVGAEQILTYIYSGVPPTFSPTVKKDDHELKRNDIWVQASQAFLNGVKYNLEALKEAGRETVLFQATRLCRYWDTLDLNMRQRRVEMIGQVWSDWESLEMPISELITVRLRILKGLVRYADQVSGSPLLHELMKTNERFMADYMWIFWYEARERRSRDLEVKDE